mgnify:CR=1 FL=1
MPLSPLQRFRILNFSLLYYPFRSLSRPITENFPRPSEKQSRFWPLTKLRHRKKTRLYQGSVFSTAVRISRRISAGTVQHRQIDLHIPDKIGCVDQSVLRIVSAEQDAVSLRSYLIPIRCPRSVRITSSSLSGNRAEQTDSDTLHFRAMFSTVRGTPS